MSEYGYLRVVYVRSFGRGTCPECREPDSREMDEFGERINHYLGHGYAILSSGSDGGGGGGDVVRHVALLGKPRTLEDVLRAVGESGD